MRRSLQGEWVESGGVGVESPEQDCSGPVLLHVEDLPEWAATKRRTPAPSRMPPRMSQDEGKQNPPLPARGFGLTGLVGTDGGGSMLIEQGLHSATGCSGDWKRYLFRQQTRPGNPAVTKPKCYRCDTL